MSHKQTDRYLPHGRIGNPDKRRRRSAGKDLWPPRLAPRHRISGVTTKLLIST